MTFVDHDQIEEAGRELAIEFLVLLRPRNRLIKTEIDLEGSVDAAFLVECQGRSSLVPSCRSMVLALVDSFAIAPPNGRKSFTIVWSISTLRSARNRMRFLRPAFHKRQMI